jgi:hypothetical protein
MATIICVLYDDPKDGYPTSYARGEVPAIERYYDGTTTPTPERIDFTPGELLGSVSGELGLRKFVEERGHRLVVTSDKEGPDSVLERELPEAEIVISQPFWPAYLTAERIAKAPNLKLAVTAGIGSDHVDIDAAIAHNITVAEVTYSNSEAAASRFVRPAAAGLATRSSEGVRPAWAAGRRPRQAISARAWAAERGDSADSKTRSAPRRGGEPGAHLLNARYRAW